jgi:hypothetical protein
MSRRRLDVSPTQAIASMLATLTAAIAASSLGIAGTIIGAAVMSLASTVGAAIYKHYLARGHEGLRAAVSGNGIAAAVLGQHQSPDPDETARLGADGQAGVESQDGADAQPAERRPTAGQRAAAADSAGARVRTALAGRAGLAGPAPAGQAGLGYTAAEHPVADPDAGGTSRAPQRPAARQDPGDAAGLWGAARLRVPGSRADAGLENADGVTGPGTADGLDGATGGRGKPTSGRHGTRSGAHRGLVLAGAVLGAFVVAMGAVTAVEAIAGKPLETLIWHRAGSGTTIGSVVGHPAHHRPAPSQSPSAQPSSTSPGPVSPTPTPSESVIPSPGTSSGPGAGASAGTGTQAQGTTPAPS